MKKDSVPLVSQLVSLFVCLASVVKGSGDLETIGTVGVKAVA
jgi:hypothetical protein